MPEKRELPPFERIELAGANDVRVRIGTEQTVVVHADAELLGAVLTRVDHGTLVVDNDDRTTVTESPMHVDVTLPRLVGVALSGSGFIAVETLDAETLSVELSGSGVVSARGTTDVLDAGLDGSGELQLQELDARNVRVRLSGTGRAKVAARERLDADLSGTGSIVYTGTAHVSSNVTGIGSVTPGR
jgi:hypothetical protein